MNIEFKPALTETRRVLFNALSSGQRFTYNGKSYINGLISFGSQSVHVAVNEKNHEDVAFLFGEIVEIEDGVFQKLHTLDDGDYFLCNGTIWILTLVSTCGETDSWCYSIDENQTASRLSGDTSVVKLEVKSSTLTNRN